MNKDPTLEYDSRAEEKQQSRVRDEARLEAGEVSLDQLKVENNFFAVADKAVQDGGDRQTEIDARQEGLGDRTKAFSWTEALTVRATSQVYMHPNRGPFQSEAAALTEIVSRLAAELQPEAIWLFGSRARGDHRADSDFDLLVIASDGAGNAGRDYDRAHAPIAGLGVGADVVPCSLGDFERARSDPTGLIAEIIRTGRVVYSRPK